MLPIRLIVALGLLAANVIGGREVVHLALLYMPLAELDCCHHLAVVKRERS